MPIEAARQHGAMEYSEAPVDLDVGGISSSMQGFVARRRRPGCGAMP